MSYEISVPTPFNDVSELAESFHSRVDEERLMLPSGESVPEGEWVQFSVILADGSAALQGQGRCTQSFDNGDDRAPEHRFDVVIDSLQLDEMAQIYFERILQVRAAYAGDEPQTGETEVPEGAHVDQAAAEQAYAQQVAAEQAAAEQAAAEQAYAEQAYAEQAAAEQAAAEQAYADQAAAEGLAGEVAEAQAVSHVEPDEFSDGGTMVAEAPDLGAAEAQVHAEPAAEEAFEQPQAAPVTGADAYVSELGAGHTRAVAYDEVVGEAEVEAVAEIDDAVVIDADELPSEELDSGLIEDADVGGAPPPSPSAAPSLAVPSESRIYELPAPQAPGALPAPHAQEAVVTRPVLHATWSPQARAREGTGDATGMFAYAPGAGLPLPEAPPRPDIDPSLHVAPAPQPGDAYAGPGVAPAEPQATHDAVAHAQAEHAEADYAEAGEHVEAGAEYAEVDPAEVDPAEVDPAEGEYAEGEYAEGEYAEGEYAEAGYAEADYGEAEYAEAGHEEDELASYGDEGAYVEGAPQAGDDPEAGVERGEAAGNGAGHNPYPDEEQTAQGGHGAEVQHLDYDEGYDELQTMDANTRQVDVSGLGDDIPIDGSETLQVEIPEEEPG